jgi:hypothetical protein
MFFAECEEGVYRGLQHSVLQNSVISIGVIVPFTKPSKEEEKSIQFESTFPRPLGGEDAKSGGCHRGQRTSHLSLLQDLFED